MPRLDCLKVLEARSVLKPLLFSTPGTATLPSHLSSWPNERSRIENKLYRTYFRAINVGPKRYRERYRRRGGKSHFIEEADIVSITENLFDIWFRQVYAFIILEVRFYSIK